MDALVGVLREWCEKKGVRLGVLFGSQASGRVHSHSDVDVAIWPKNSLEPLQKLAWVNELMDLVENEVSLVIVSPSLDPVLGWEIAKGGKVVWETRPGFWQLERARLWHLYNDSAPHRKALGASLKAFAQKYQEDR